MRLYLRHIETDSYSDSADYPDNEPFPAPEGFEWIEGEPEGLTAYRLVSLEEKLNTFFESSLTPELQADFAPLKAAVKLELDLNRVNIARLVIERAAIPAELEPVRQQMLAQFPSS